MNLPLVSIIIPCFNCEKWIERTLQSVNSQTYYEYEIIAIDDCSTDRTKDILNKLALKDPKLKLIFNSENKGVAESRNIGINKAQGDYFSFLDSDDTWESNKLEIQVNRMISSSIDFSYTGFSVISESGELIKKIPVPEVVKYQDLLKGSDICCSSVIVSRKGLGDFRFSKTFHEDYLLWLELLKRFNAYGVTESVVNYTWRKDSISSNKLHAAIKQYQIYNKKIGMNHFKALFYFSHYAINGVFKHYL